MKSKQNLIGILTPLIAATLLHTATAAAGDYVRVIPLPSISASASGDVNSLNGKLSMNAGASAELQKISVGADQFFSFTGIGGVASATTPSTASGDVTVTYELPPSLIPEPNLLMLLFMTGMFLMLVRRRGDRNRALLNQTPFFPSGHARKS